MYLRTAVLNFYYYEADMIYIFNGDEVEEVTVLPLNPQYPLGTWACAGNGLDHSWYQCCKGTMEVFWGYYGRDCAIIPNDIRLKLLLLGPPK